MREPSDYLTEFSARLDALGIDHVVIGAFAALRYRREPRLTTDVDFLIREVGDVIAALDDEGFELTVHRDDDGNPYAVFVRGQNVKVDLLVAETDYHRGAIDRAVDGVLTVEDVLVHKLIAWRPRDRDDIASILDAHVAIDDDAVRTWAAHWDVEERWDQSLRRR